MLIDSHCHLNCLDDKSSTLDDYIQRSLDNGVTNLLCVCIDLDGFSKVIEIANMYSHIHATIGIHPNSAPEQAEKIDNVFDKINDEKIIAIGETGLDYYRTTKDLEKQRKLFARHIEISKSTNKPLIVHSRDAKQDTVGMLAEYDAGSVGGIIHCFTEDIDMARKCLDLGFYISFSGIITFKNAVQIQEVAKFVPLDRILIETDSPYLAPMPHRGKPNEPAYVKFVAEKIAELRNDEFENIAKCTSENYFKLFSNNIKEI